MNFGEVLYALMYEILFPYGMENSPEEKEKWQRFPLNDLAQDDQTNVQTAFEEQLRVISAWLDENGLMLSDLAENGTWKTGNDEFIGLLSSLAATLPATYDQSNGGLAFGGDVTVDAAYPFVAVAAAEAPASPTLESVLTDIGNAIRGKDGSTAAIPATEMANRISAIQTGADVSGVTATEADVLTGKTFVDSTGALKTGTLPEGKKILLVKLISETALGFVVSNDTLGFEQNVAPGGERGPEYLPDYCPLDDFILGTKILYTDWMNMGNGDWERLRQSMTYSADEYGDGMLTIRLALEG